LARRLCGYPPFYAENAPALFKKIMDVKYDFEDPSWDDVSEDAKNLIRNLLKKEPSERYTARQCLDDKWVQGQASSKKTITVTKVSLGMKGKAPTDAEGDGMGPVPSGPGVISDSE
jgi:serine/threonine protein kinase